MGEPLHQVQRAERIFPPGVPGRKHRRVDLHAEFLGVLLDPSHILRPDINRIVKNSDRLQFPDGDQRRAKVGLITFGICGSQRDIHVQPMSLRLLKCF